MDAERREFDNSDCYWGGELDGIWDSKRIETNGLNHVKLFLVLLKCNTLIKINYGGYGILGNLCLFLFLLFSLLLLLSKSQGSGIWQHICNKNIHFRVNSRLADTPL